MDLGYLEMANSFGMWIIALIMVGIVIVQSVIFMTKAYKAGTSVGLSKKQMNSGLRAGIITSLGPSFAVLIGLVSLVSIIGGPMAWMRLSVIGAVMFEGLAVNCGAEALGTTVGAPDFGLVGLASAFWVMCLGSIGWLVITGLFTTKLESMRNYIVRGREQLLPVVSVAAVLGAFGYQVSKFLVKIGPGSIAALISGLSMVACYTIANKRQINWLKEWSLGLSMVVGMFSAALF